MMPQHLMASVAPKTTSDHGAVSATGAADNMQSQWPPASLEI